MIRFEQYLYLFLSGWIAALVHPMTGCLWGVLCWVVQHCAMLHTSASPRCVCLTSSSTATFFLSSFLMTAAMHSGLGSECFIISIENFLNFVYEHSMYAVVDHLKNLDSVPNVYLFVENILTGR